MNVELIGVSSAGPVSAVGEVMSTVCSRRLTDDLFFLKKLYLCVARSPTDSSRLCRWSDVVVVAVVAVSGLALSEPTDRMSSEGGDLKVCSCAKSEADGSKAAPNLKSLSKAAFGSSSSTNALSLWWNVDARFRGSGFAVDVSILSCFVFAPESRRLRTPESRFAPELGKLGSEVCGGGPAGDSGTVLVDGGLATNAFFDPLTAGRVSSATVESDVPAVVRSEICELCQVLLE